MPLFCQCVRSFSEMATNRQDGSFRYRSLTCGPQVVALRGILRSSKQSPGMRAIDEFLRDTYFALRMLRKSRVFSAVAIATLALGIGVNTAVFGVINAIIFRPLPVKDSARLEVIAAFRASTPTLGPVSFPDLQDYRAATREVFDDIGGYTVGFRGLAYQGVVPERVLVTWVTGNYFSLLGIHPAIGRIIAEEEAFPGDNAPVAVLGHSTWLRRFGGTRSIVGQNVTLNGHPFTVIGVVPENFRGTFAFSLKPRFPAGELDKPKRA
jgi:hypothetical protein